jgi:hypothetical protein
MYTLEIEGTPGYKQISNLSAAVIMHNQLFPEKLGKHFGTDHNMVGNDIARSENNRLTG